MPSQGNVQVADPVAGQMVQIFPTSQPSGVTMGVPVVIVEDLAADASVHGVQNPLDCDVLVSVAVRVTTVDATETIDIGVDTDGTTSDDTLIDGLSVATAGVFSSADDPGTNGNQYQYLDKKGGTTDYVVFTASAGTDTLAGKLVITFVPLGT